MMHAIASNKSRATLVPRVALNEPRGTEKADGAPRARLMSRSPSTPNIRLFVHRGGAESIPSRPCARPPTSVVFFHALACCSCLVAAFLFALAAALRQKGGAESLRQFRWPTACCSVRLAGEKTVAARNGRVIRGIPVPGRRALTADACRSSSRCSSWTVVFALPLGLPADETACWAVPRSSVLSVMIADLDCSCTLVTRRVERECSTRQPGRRDRLSYRSLSVLLIALGSGGGLSQKGCRVRHCRGNPFRALFGADEADAQLPP